MKTLDYVAEEDTPIRGPESNRKYSRARDSARSLGKRPFVSWDGEGAGDGKDEAQNYCVLGNSAGGIILVRAGYISTDSAFDFMLSEGERLPNAIHVAFSFNYDVNQMLRDIPFPVLKKLHKTNTVHWNGYRIEWYPGKWFYVRDDNERRIKIYDTWGFWHSSLVKALEADPELSLHPDLERIKAGKSDRGTFSYDEIDEKVIPYFHAEMRLHAALCEKLRETLTEATVTAGGEEGVNLVPHHWYGPSAVVSTLYRKANLKSAMNRPISDLKRERKHKRGKMQQPDPRLSYTLPDDVNRVARASFAGGRFEQHKIGAHHGKVYGYDITSAYPYAQLLLPQLSHGTWYHVYPEQMEDFKRDYAEEPPWGFYRINYDWERARHGIPWASRYRGEQMIHPLFRRDEYGLISYPAATHGWYPTYSAGLVWNWEGVDIEEAYIYEPAYNEGPPLNPFYSGECVDFMEMYEKKEYYEKVGRMDLRYAMKITLNSGYGKTAQKSGVEEGDNLPAFHQIEWAAHITDHCRASIYKAALAAFEENALISIETDAIYTTRPIQYVENQVGSGLGKWSKDEYDGFIGLQSGIYFTNTNGKWDFHNRGLDKDSFTADDVIRHFGKLDYRAPIWDSINGTLSTFCGIGQAGIGIVNYPSQFYAKWLRWPVSEREIRLGHPQMKRCHASIFCDACHKGIPPSKGLHALSVPPYKSGESVPKRYAWIPEDYDAEFMDTMEERWN